MPNNPTIEELYEDAPCGYVSLRPDGTISRANRTFLRSIGRTADELVERLRLVDLMTAGSRLYAETHWRPVLELAGELREMPVDLVRSDGSRLSVLLNATRVVRPDGTEAGVRASLFDATDRRRYERELIAARDTERGARRRVERLQRLTAALSDAVEVEQVLSALAGAIFEGLSPRRCTIVQNGKVGFERREMFVVPGPSRSLETPLMSGEHPIGVLQLELPADRVLDEADEAFVAACAASGATALRRAQLYAEMERLALHDPLTGLPNRLSLLELLRAEVERAGRTGGSFAVALLALDGFKLLNDTRGHAVGDEALRAIAARLAEAVGEPGVVARPAGDEFVVICPGLGDDADLVARTLSSVLDEPLSLAGDEILLRASVGLVVAGGDDDPEGILGDADVAMLEAKRASGEPYVRFDASMRRRAEERVLIEEGLREALRDGDLRVFYQPIVHAEDGTLSKLEALVRWEHPERGLVSPGAFIPVAEDCGLIVDIGRWVLGEATAQLASWRAAGIVGDHVGVTVNVSARQLSRSDFVPDVAAALAAAGLEDRPELLGLELTESMLMRSDDRRSLARLDELGDLGVGLLLDDFGTGASSLARLRRLPFDTLKIDRAFVSGVGQDDGEDDAIVGAIVALGRALDLRIVAEGVETTGQLDRLSGLGVHDIQGFFFSRPVPAGDVPAAAVAATAARAGARVGARG